MILVILVLKRTMKRRGKGKGQDRIPLQTKVPFSRQPKPEKGKEHRVVEITSIKMH